MRCLSVLPGRVTLESVVFSFGTILIDLLSGKRIPPTLVSMFLEFNFHCVSGHFHQLQGHTDKVV
jgi:hypothetical protein